MKRQTSKMGRNTLSGQLNMQIAAWHISNYKLGREKEAKEWAEKAEEVKKRIEANSN